MVRGGGSVDGEGGSGTVEEGGGGGGTVEDGKGAAPPSRMARGR
jgi:hypothetical protein